MTIAWADFTPWASLGGGMLIGAAAALLILSNGRIAGISGILGALLRPARGDIAWRAAFLTGLLAAPWGYGMAAAMPPIHVAAGDLSLLAGGLLVGLGTRYGAGCTSGHGVCGLARLSPRSAVATGVFMLAGFATVCVIRHVIA